MKRVFVDFEMSTISRDYSEERRICRQEIIEIGAVMLDEVYTEIASFKHYVRPVYARHVSNTIYDLTGIEDHFLHGCDGIQSELEAFAHWCLSLDEDVTIYAWSENDLIQIKKEFLLKGLVPSESLEKVIHRWRDLQADYDEAVGASRPTALHKALDTIGVGFEGRMHDALDDARNTARVYVELSNLEEFKKTIGYSRNYTVLSDNCVTLGDLFDFSKLSFDESA